MNRLYLPALSTLTVIYLALTITSINARLGRLEQQQPTPAATATPQTSASPSPRVTPTAASRSRRIPTEPGQPERTVVDAPRNRAGSLLNWRALRDCESSNNYADKDSATYRGAYQFDRRTWQSVGGSGDPATASPADPDMRAQRLYNRRGRQPWPVCGRYL